MAQKRTPPVTKFNSHLRFRVPLETRLAVEALAKRKIKTPAEVGREAVAAYLEQHGIPAHANGKKNAA